MNQKLLQWLKPESVEVEIIRVEEFQEAGIEESERSGNVELRRQKEQPQMAGGMQLIAEVEKF